MVAAPPEPDAMCELIGLRLLGTTWAVLRQTGDRFALQPGNLTPLSREGIRVLRSGNGQTSEKGITSSPAALSLLFPETVRGYTYRTETAAAQLHWSVRRKPAAAGLYQIRAIQIFIRCFWLVVPSKAVLPEIGGILTRSRLPFFTLYEKPCAV